jgi:aminoglycoside 2'-N-acetyltransferase I
MALIRALATDELRAREVAILRQLLESAWADDPEEFTDEDWEHAVGGVHFLLQEDGEIVAHASVVERELHTGNHHLATGYVEAVATRPTHQRRGHGSAVMRGVGEYIDRTFALGGLGSGRFSFYQRLGWVVWKGPTFVRTEAGPVRTAEEDGYVFVRFTPTTPQLDVSAAISCDWRSGDVW